MVKYVARSKVIGEGEEKGSLGVSCGPVVKGGIKWTEGCALSCRKGEL